jgi:hypothetical protein
LGGTSPLYASYMLSAGARMWIVATGIIRTVLLLIDALDEHVVAWRVRRELQYVGNVSIRRLGPGFVRCWVESKYVTSSSSS